MSRSHVLVFGLFFATTFGFGYRAGYLDQRSTERVVHYAFSRIGVHRLPGTYFFTYLGSSGPLYIFHEDTQRVAPIGPLALQFARVQAPLVPRVNFDDPALKSLVGTAMLGMTATNLIESLALRPSAGQVLSSTGGTRVKLVLAAFVGIASGYSLGYWVATGHKPLAPESPEVLEVVRQPKYWTERKGELFVDATCHLQDAIAYLDPDSARRYAPRLAALQDTAVAVAAGDMQVESAQFAQLADLSHDIEPEYQVAVQAHAHTLLARVTWGGFISVFLVLVVGAVWWSRRREADPQYFRLKSGR